MMTMYTKYKYYEHSEGSGIMYGLSEEVRFKQEGWQDSERHKNLGWCEQKFEDLKA